MSQLRQQSVDKGAAAAARSGADASATGRSLRELTLQEPIRYGPGDPVERWLMQVLCLDAADYVPRVPPVLPHPDECELFYVERDTLFSGHKVSELALQRMMSLYVASHYKNTPNDLLLLSDAPAHHLFVLTAPVLDASKVRHTFCRACLPGTRHDSCCTGTATPQELRMPLPLLRMHCRPAGTRLRSSELPHTCDAN